MTSRRPFIGWWMRCKHRWQRSVGRQWHQLGCHKPAEFTDKVSPDEAEAWLRKCEKIFTVMSCADEQKLLFATYLLNGDAEY